MSRKQTGPDRWEITYRDEYGTKKQKTVTASEEAAEILDVQLGRAAQQARNEMRNLTRGADLALSVSHLLDVLNELNHPEIGFVSFGSTSIRAAQWGRAVMLMGPVKVRRRGSKRERLGGGNALVAPAASEDVEVPASAESDMDL